tara:strand:+ start:4581 stop:4832 length:252 start_codon:yes stop_codon:yes gene_type:complete
MKVGDIIVLSAQGKKTKYLKPVRNCIGRVTAVHTYYGETEIRSVSVQWTPKPAIKNTWGSHWLSKNISRSNLKHYATKKELRE